MINNNDKIAFYSDNINLISFCKNLQQKRQTFSLTTLTNKKSVKNYCQKNKIKYIFFKEKNPEKIRRLLNTLAKKHKLNKIATDYCLYDEAESLLMNQFKNNMKLTSHLGPMSDSKPFIPRIKPFYFCTREEIQPNKFQHKGFRDDIRLFLDRLEKKHPGIKHGLVTSFLELLPLLKQHYFPR